MSEGNKCPYVKFAISVVPGRGLDVVMFPVMCSLQQGRQLVVTNEARIWMSMSVVEMSSNFFNLTIALL